MRGPRRQSHPILKLVSFANDVLGTGRSMWEITGAGLQPCAAAVMITTTHPLGSGRYLSSLLLLE